MHEMGGASLHIDLGQTVRPRASNEGTRGVEGHCVDRFVVLLPVAGELLHAGAALHVPEADR